MVLRKDVSFMQTLASEANADTKRTDEMRMFFPFFLFPRTIPPTHSARYHLLCVPFQNLKICRLKIWSNRPYSFNTNYAYVFYVPLYYSMPVCRIQNTKYK